MSNSNATTFRDRYGFDYRRKATVPELLEALFGHPDTPEFLKDAIFTAIDDKSSNDLSALWFGWALSNIQEEKP